MREIIYIQAGSASNHIGTHFWNTQESYFTYDENTEAIVDHDISFREGLSTQDEATYCPRVLLFDHRSNFGAMSKYNELYSDPSETDVSRSLWNGSVAEFKQSPISKSQFQQRLERGEDDNVDERKDVTTADIRYWSDFNRVFYVPRSLQMVSDLPNWEASKNEWAYGKSAFEKYDSEHSFSEGDLRQFVEECDNFQGFQSQFDNSSFGSFSIALMESVRDEFPKIPIISFPILSGVDPSRGDVEDVFLRRSVLTDAACLHALNDLSSQNIPIQPPSSWLLGSWLKHIDLEANNTYQTSAVLSAHIESATLPMRLKGRHEDLSSLCHQLNWSQNTQFSHLSGVLPFVDGDEFDERIYDFSVIAEAKIPILERDGTLLAQRNTTRGLNISQTSIVDEFFSSAGLEPPFLSNVHAPPYPIPSSYPSFFLPLTDSRSSKRTRTEPPPLPRRTSTLLVSSLTTSTASAKLFKAHAQFLDDCVKRRIDFAGMEAEILKEMVNDLWTIHDGYAESKPEDAEEGLDEDEDA